MKNSNQRTVYVPDADRLVWEMAKVLSGQSMSATISKALNEFVNREMDLKDKAASAVEAEVL